MTNLQKWNLWLKDLESPQIFIDWTLFWCISTALQRRVYMGDYDFSPIFPNIYVTFVADPGIGKSMAARLAGSKILKTFRYLDAKKVAAGLPPDKQYSDKIHFSADKTSIQSLIEQITKSTTSYEAPFVNSEGQTYTKTLTHSSLAVLLSEEMSSLFGNPEEGIDELLNQCWDAQDYRYQTLSRGENVIKDVCVTLLGCTTPERMRKLMAKGCLQQGFTARTIALYADKPRKRVLNITFNEEQKQAFADVKQHIKNLLEVKGQVRYSPEALEYFTQYYEGDGKDPIPPMERDRVNHDKRLKDYYGRKKLHIMKLSMILHFMENLNSMEISLDTLLLTLKFLKEAEMNMHLALASQSRNPLYEYACQVYHDIASSGKNGLSIIRIKLMYSSEMNETELAGVLKFLTETQHIRTAVIGNKTCYVAVNPEKLFLDR